jgi:hypothetical protein
MAAVVLQASDPPAAEEASVVEEAGVVEAVADETESDDKNTIGRKEPYDINIREYNIFETSFHSLHGPVVVCVRRGAPFRPVVPGKNARSCERLVACRT